METRLEETVKTVIEADQRTVDALPNGIVKETVIELRQLAEDMEDDDQ